MIMSKKSSFKMSGRVDGTNADSYEKSILGLLKDVEESLSIDLTELTYISSLGLRVFLKVAKALKEQNKKLVLFKPTQAILDLLLMSGFDKIIEIEK